MKCIPTWWRNQAYILKSYWRRIHLSMFPMVTYKNRQMKEGDTHQNPILVSNRFITLFSSPPFSSHCMGFSGSSLVLLRWCLAVLWGCFAMSTMAMVSSSAGVNITPCQVSVSTKMTLATSLCSGRWAAQSTLLVGTALGVSRRRGSTSSWCQHRMEISHGGVTMRTSATSTTSVNWSGPEAGSMAPSKNILLWIPKSTCTPQSTCWITMTGTTTSWRTLTGKRPARITTKDNKWNGLGQSKASALSFVVQNGTDELALSLEQCYMYVQQAALMLQGFKILNLW